MILVSLLFDLGFASAAFYFGKKGFRNEIQITLKSSNKHVTNT